VTKKKQNKRNSWINLKILIPIIAVIILLLIVSAVTVTSSKTRVAFLNIEEGQVEVDTGNGWQAAEDSMALGLDDKVRTIEGKAVIILYETILVQLEENTEITIEELSKENVKVYQSSGSTWNKFAAISGIQSYQVETPTTVATVRGTSFWVDVESVGVSDGKVNVQIKETERPKEETEEKLLELTAGKKVMLDNEIPIIEDFSDEDNRHVVEKKIITVKHLKKLRDEEINKHKTTYALIKKMKGWSDKDVADYLDELDQGKHDMEEVKRNSPVPLKSLDKLTKITEEIMSQNRFIKDMRIEPIKDNVKQEVDKNQEKEDEDKQKPEDKNRQEPDPRVLQTNTQQEKVDKTIIPQDLRQARELN